MNLALIPLLAFVFDPKSVPAPLRYETNVLGTCIPAGLYSGEMYPMEWVKKAAAGGTTLQPGFGVKLDLHIGRDGSFEHRGEPLRIGAMHSEFGLVQRLLWQPASFVLFFDRDEMTEYGRRHTTYVLSGLWSPADRKLYIGLADKMTTDPEEMFKLAGQLTLDVPEPVLPLGLFPEDDPAGG